MRNGFMDEVAQELQDRTPRLANWGGALLLVLVLPPSNRIPSKQPAISRDVTEGCYKGGHGHQRRLSARRSAHGDFSVGIGVHSAGYFARRVGAWRDGVAERSAASDDEHGGAAKRY